MTLASGIWADAIIHWIHLLAAITWLGGMVFTALVLNPVARLELPVGLKSRLIRALGLRFRSVEAVCVGALAATGTFKLFRLGMPLAMLLSGAYGRILALKLALLACMLALGALHSFVWGPALKDLAIDSRQAAAIRARLVFWARVNLGMGLVVVFCATLLRMGFAL